MAEKPPCLRVEDLVTGYGKRRILHGVSLSVAPGEIVAVIGHNGAGKSTALKAVFGLLPIWQGSVAFGGSPLCAPSPRRLIRAGVGYVPQGNRVFADLTVLENLVMGGITIPGRAKRAERIEQVFRLFPGLSSRSRQRAGSLSGGEKQMLSLANALIGSPQLLLLDEPSLGLSPPLVSEALGRVRQISRGLGVSVLIIEQKVREVLEIADRVYVLRSGAISFSGPALSLKDEAKLRDFYL